MPVSIHSLQQLAAQERMGKPWQIWWTKRILYRWMAMKPIIVPTLSISMMTQTYHLISNLVMMSIFRRLKVSREIQVRTRALLRRRSPCHISNLSISERKREAIEQEKRLSLLSLSKTNRWRMGSILFTIRVVVKLKTNLYLRMYPPSRVQELN